MNLDEVLRGGSASEALRVRLCERGSVSEALQVRLCG